MPGGRPQLFDINSSVLNLILNTFALKHKDASFYHFSCLITFVLSLSSEIRYDYEYSTN